MSTTPSAPTHPPPRSPLRRYLVVGGSALVALAMVAVVLGQAASGWDLSIRATSGGGGDSAGGAYTLTGVIGQPFASVSTNSGTSVASGLLGGSGGKFTRTMPLLSSDK